LVTDKRTDSLVTALNTLIQDPNKRTAMGTLASSRAQSLFSVDRMINAHIALYKSIVK
jgi:glycosyltransferase involved in cell wall biosynthesis